MMLSADILVGETAMLMQQVGLVWFGCILSTFFLLLVMPRVIGDISLVYP